MESGKTMSTKKTALPGKAGNVKCREIMCIQSRNIIPAPDIYLNIMNFPKRERQFR